MSELVIRHQTLLSIGLGDGGPAPPDLCAQLLPAMTYMAVKQRTRGQQYDPITGDRQRLEFERTELYEIEPSGRLACPVGYLARVWRTAAALGYTPVLVDRKFTGNPDNRPGAFRFDPMALARYFNPRAKQDECISQIANNWYGQIAAATAFGKTKLIGALGLAYPDAEHILVVPGKEVMKTARGHVAEYIPEGDIGMVGGKYNEPKRFTIMIINSLAARMMQVRPDFLWVDECHGTVSEKWAEAIAVASRRARVFGFSASLVERFDNAHFKLEALYGEQIFSITQQEATAAGLVVPVHVMWHDVLMTSNPCTGLQADTARKRHGIWYNKTRNDLIAKLVMEYPTGVKRLVIVETVAHALELARRIPGSEVCVGSVSDRLQERIVDSGAVEDSRIAVLESERSSVIDRFLHGNLDVLIGTTLHQGFSPDSVSVLFRADARKSSVPSIQIPGRVCRLHGESGKQFAVVHDFSDQFDDGFKNAAAVRQRDYDDLGFPQFRARDGSQIHVRRRQPKMT